MKMKIIIASSLAIMAFAHVFAQQETIQNGDMEIWQDGKALPRQWATFYVIEKEGIFSRSVEAQSGKYAIQVDFSPQKAFDNRRFFSLPMTLEAGKYHLKISFRGKGELRFISLNKSGTSASGKNSETNAVGTPLIGQVDAKDWKASSIDFDVPKAADYELTICINSADKLLIDDVSMEKL